MRLRPRQKTFVERSVAALASRGNTLGVAPTGAGKTIMLSAVTGEMIGDGAKACVLAHRDELTAQNRAKFQRVVPGVATSVIDATEKSWGGQVAFAMVPTLARASNLADMPRLDLLVVDEAHHAVADSYRRIIDRVREANPDARIFGVTATPNRGDRKGLREVFDNVADQVGSGRVEVELGFDGATHFDEQKMLRVLHNLARNAADAMPGGGHFWLRTRLEGDKLVIEAADDGPGIPPSVKARLFELFASGTSGGTGLGLAIVKKIVDDHGGTITCDTGPRSAGCWSISLMRNDAGWISCRRPSGRGCSAARSSC